MKKLNLIGHKYGKLTVVEAAGRSASNRTLWLCHCECGGSIVANIVNLRSGDTKSCGCINSTQEKHGHSRKGCKSRTYRIWAGMLTRCRNPKHKDYRYYGGKGITVCDRWHSFEYFLEDMGEAPSGMTIDRIDSDKGYNPGNCRWLDHVENVRRANRDRWAKTKGGSR